MKGHPFLEKYLAKYDQWLAEGGITHASRVIPVGRALARTPRALSPSLALESLRSSQVYALADCVCRTTLRHCDRPVETCFFLDEVAEKLLAKGKARRVGLDEAENVLARCEEAGLVHMTLYQPVQRPLALCNCCPCCCHDLQLVKYYGRADLVAPSGWLPATDEEACTGCGQCVEVCAFEARALVEGGLVFDAQRCRGCGLCLVACPAGAISEGAPAQSG